jgi:hypothetical protein
MDRYPNGMNDALPMQTRPVFLTSDLVSPLQM